MKFYIIKYLRHIYRFYLNRYFCLTKLLNIAMVQGFEVILGQTLKHYVWICNLYRSLEKTVKHAVCCWYAFSAVHLSQLH